MAPKRKRKDDDDDDVKSAKKQHLSLLGIVNSFRSSAVSQRISVYQWPPLVIQCIIEYMKPIFVLTERIETNHAYFEVLDLIEQKSVWSDDEFGSFGRGPLSELLPIFHVRMNINQYVIGCEWIMSVSKERNSNRIAAIFPINHDLSSADCRVVLPRSLSKITDHVTFLQADPTNHCFAYWHIYGRVLTPLFLFVDNQANTRWYMPGGYNLYNTCSTKEQLLLCTDDGAATMVMSIPKSEIKEMFEGTTPPPHPNDPLLFYRTDMFPQNTHSDRFITFEQSRRPLRGHIDTMFIIPADDMSSFVMYDIVSETFEIHPLHGLEKKKTPDGRDGVYLYGVLIISRLPSCAYRILSVDCVLWSFQSMINESTAVFLWQRGASLRYLDQLDSTRNVIDFYSPP